MKIGYSIKIEFVLLTLDNITIPLLNSNFYLFFILFFFFSLCWLLAFKHSLSSLLSLLDFPVLSFSPTNQHIITLLHVLLVRNTGRGNKDNKGRKRMSDDFYCLIWCYECDQRPTNYVTEILLSCTSGYGFIYYFFFIFSNHKSIYQHQL